MDESLPRLEIKLNIEDSEDGGLLPIVWPVFVKVCHNSGSVGFIRGSL